MTSPFRRTGTAAGLLAAALAAGGCRSSNYRPPAAVDEVAVAANPAPEFAVGVTPRAAPPSAVGTPVGFRLSSSENALRATDCRPR